MTLIWSDDRGKATRTTTLKLVPSQFTERIQATDPMRVWPPVTLVDRLACWYAVVPRRYLVTALIALCALVAWGLVAAV